MEICDNICLVPGPAENFTTHCSPSARAHSEAGGMAARRCTSNTPNPPNAFLTVRRAKAVVWNGSHLNSESLRLSHQLFSPDDFWIVKVVSFSPSNNQSRVGNVTIRPCLLKKKKKKDHFRALIKHIVYCEHWFETWQNLVNFVALYTVPICNNAS